MSATQEEQKAHRAELGQSKGGLSAWEEVWEEGNSRTCHLVSLLLSFHILFRLLDGGHGTIFISV
jgi:hypothetical protein